MSFITDKILKYWLIQYTFYEKGGNIRDPK